MARPNKLTDDQPTPADWAKEVLYNPAGQMTQLKYSKRSEMGSDLIIQFSRSKIADRVSMGNRSEMGSDLIIGFCCKTPLI